MAAAYPIGTNKDGSILYSDGTSGPAQSNQVSNSFAQGPLYGPPKPGAVPVASYAGDPTGQTVIYSDGTVGALGQTSNAFDTTLANAPQSGGTTTTTDYGTKILGNKTYDLNDEQQRLAYYNDLKVQLTQQRDQALQQAQASWDTLDNQSRQQYQQYLTTIDQNLADIDAQAKQYAQSYLKTVKGFNESKGQGDVNRQNYFAGLSPNAFQSSQATSQGYANDKYQQGLTDLANQGNQAVGLGYINAYDPNSTGSMIGNLDPTSQYGRNVSSVNTQKTGLQNAFDLYNTQAAQNLQQNQTKIGQSYQDALGANASSLGAADIAQGTNPFQYGIQPTAPYQAAQPDLSQYTPYTSFSSLSDTSIPGNTYKVPVSQGNAYQQPTLDAWLGRTNTVLPANQKNDWFSNYMMGKVTS